jgi:hypothetical protein
MADTGFILAATGANVDRSSQTAWTNAGNITADDGSYAYNSGNPPNYTDWLVATFDLSSVPAGATIVGIALRIQRLALYANEIYDSSLRIAKGTTVVGDDKASATKYPTTFTNADYGGATDLWGTTWTRDEILTLRTRLSCYIPTGGTQVRVDVVWVKVYYTTGTTYEVGLTLSGAAAIADTPNLDRPGNVSLPTAAAIAQAIVTDVQRTLSLSGAATQGQVATCIMEIAQALSGNASMAMVAGRLYEIAAAMTAQAQASGQVDMIIPRDISLPVAAVILPEATIELLRALSLSGEATIIQAADLTRPTAQELSASAFLNLVATLVAERAISLSAAAGMALEIEKASGYFTTLELSTAAAMVQAAILEIFTSKTLGAAAEISLSSLVEATREAIFSASGQVTVAGIIEAMISLTFGAAAALSPGLSADRQGLAELTAGAQIGVSAPVDIDSFLALAAAGGFQAAAELGAHEFMTTLGLLAIADFTPALSLELRQQLALAGIGAFSAEIQGVYDTGLLMTGLAGMGAAVRSDISPALTLEVTAALDYLVRVGKLVCRGNRIIVRLLPNEVNLRLS